jgi:hypothetical protein
MLRPVIVITVFLACTGLLSAETGRQRDQREADLKQVELRLDEISRKIAAVRVNPADLQEDGKKELSRITDDLRAKQEIAQRKFGEMRGANRQDWDRLKAEANAAIDELHRIAGRLQSLAQKR